MKTFTRAAITGVGVSVFLSVSCSKDSLEDPDRKKNRNENCDIASVTQQYSGGQSDFIFSKTYDLSGQRVTRIDAGLYSGGAIWKNVHLNITYDYNTIYFVSAENAGDTGIVLQVDNAGRPVHAEVGEMIDEGFGPHEFYYANNRLQWINIDSGWMRIWFRYDVHGNNTQIVTDSSEGYARINHVYEYAKGKKRAPQCYLDEARGFSFNILTILHAAGYFPELNPIHPRVRSTVHWGPYLAYDYVQKDHVFDKSDRLMQYSTVSPNGQAPVATYTVGYNCANSNNHLITMVR